MRDRLIVMAAALCGALFAGFVFSLRPAPLLAQYSPTGTIPPTLGLVVTACGTLPPGTTYTAGQLAPVTLTVAGSFCVNQ